MSLYTEDEIGFMPDGGNVGGDHQITDAPSRRFQRQLDDGTWAIVTIYAYGTQHEFEEGAYVEYDVEVMTEYLLCTDPDDPGSTEIDADYHYSNPFDVGPKSDVQALEWATSLIRNFDIDWIVWNGQNPRSV